MTTNDDRDLKTWAALWQTEGRVLDAPAAEVARRVQRRHRTTLVETVFEAVVCTVACVIVWRAIVRGGHAIDLILGWSLIALVIAAAWFGVRNRRGAWRPASSSTGVFLDYLVEQNARRVRAIRYGWWLLAFELLLIVAWLLHGDARASSVSGGGQAPWWHLLYAAGMGGLGALWLRWLSRRAARESVRLDDLRRETAHP